MTSEAEETLVISYYRSSRNIRVVTTCPPEEWWATAKAGDEVTLRVVQVTEEVRRS